MAKVAAGRCSVPVFGLPVPVFGLPVPLFGLPVPLFRLQQEMKRRLAEVEAQSAELQVVPHGMWLAAHRATCSVQRAACNAQHATRLGPPSLRRHSGRTPRGNTMRKTARGNTHDTWRAACLAGRARGCAERPAARHVCTT